MALKISGGDWSPWADVAHQLVSERQGQQALNLRARQIADDRQARQQQAYMAKLGLQERKRQFDITQDFREEQAGADFLRDSQRDIQRAEDIAFRMEEAGFRRGLNETDRAVRMGAVYDTAKKQWRPINEEDPLFEAHKEYKKGQRTAANQNVELNRRVQFIDRKIRNNEKQLTDLSNERLNLITETDAKKKAAKEKDINTREKKVREDLVRDRQLYNGLYNQFFRGFGGQGAAPAATGIPAPAAASAAGAAPAATGIPAPAAASAAGAAPAATGIPAPGAAGAAPGPRTGPGLQSPREQFPGLTASIAEEQGVPLDRGASPYLDALKREDAKERGDTLVDATTEAMAAPDTVIDGRSFFVAAKHQERVKRDLIKLMAEMQKAQRSRNFKRLGELNKVRKEYFKTHRQYLTQNPDRS